MLDRIRNGTTTVEDAKLVQNIMDSSTSKSLRILVLKTVLILFLVGGLLLGISIGGLLF